MYVPNPQKWMNYYHSVATGSRNGYVQNKTGRGRQRGGSLGSTTSGFMESIEDTHLKGKPTQPQVDMVSPVKQTEDQAMYQIKRVVRKRKAHSRKSTPRKNQGRKRRRESSIQLTYLHRFKKCLLPMPPLFTRFNRVSCAYLTYLLIRQR